MSLLQELDNIVKGCYFHTIRVLLDNGHITIDDVQNSITNIVQKNISIRAFENPSIELFIFYDEYFYDNQFVMKIVANECWPASSAVDMLYMRRLDNYEAYYPLYDKYAHLLSFENLVQVCANNELYMKYAYPILEQIINENDKTTIKELHSKRIYCLKSLPNKEINLYLQNVCLMLINRQYGNNPSIDKYVLDIFLWTLLDIVGANLREYCLHNLADMKRIIAYFHETTSNIIENKLWDLVVSKASFLKMIKTIWTYIVKYEDFTDLVTDLHFDIGISTIFADIVKYHFFSDLKKQQKIISQLSTLIHNGVELTPIDSTDEINSD